MSKKYIHLIGSGGVAGIGMYRCLKDHYDIQGHDSSFWGSLAMECKPYEGNDEAIYLWNADMIIPVPDKAVPKYGTGDLAYCCDINQIELCQDKSRCAEVLGNLAPVTYWIRNTQGAGGAGAQMASEYLPGRNVSCEVAFYDNSLIGYFMKERLAYDIKGSKDPLDQRGSSVVSICIKDELILAKVLDALDIVSRKTRSKIHGFYGIDLKQDKDDNFKITEINAGRLLTASYVYYYSTGYNLALAGVKAFFKEPYKLGKYPEGYGVIRQTDCLPKIFTPKQTKDWNV